MAKYSPHLCAAMWAGAKTLLDGGFLFAFNGTVPTNETDALDMAGTHTQIAKLSVNNDGVTGLTFTAPTDRFLAKTVGQVWKGTATFVGLHAAAANLMPTFFRFCKAGDDGRGVALAGDRIQGTAGSTGSEWFTGTDPIVAGDDLSCNQFENDLPFPLP